MNFTPIPATKAPAAAAGRRAGPALSSSASAINAISSVSLCPPPTASTSSTGFKPTNAAAASGERPMR